MVHSFKQPTILVNVERTSFKDMKCSVAQCLEIVGEWWSFLIVRDAMMGVSRFDTFQSRLGISRNVLNQRLARLVGEGILERVQYEEHPPRFDYRLTEKGRDLWPILMAMRQWGDRWAAPNGPPVEVVHKDCGQVTQMVPVCSECGERLETGSLRNIAGPGSQEDAEVPSRP